jgi:DnaJ-class molecular chaperone
MKANRVGTCHKCGGNGPVADLPTGQALCDQCFGAGNLPRVSATAVIELRNATGLPMLKCKFALEEAGGDVEKAKQALVREAIDRRPRAGDMIF